VRCLTGAKFTMNAEILHWQGLTTGTEFDSTSGSWSSYQDPISGEIRNVWEPSIDTSNPSDPEPFTIACLARGIVNTGLRSQGSRTTYGANYFDEEIIHMWVPSSVKITKRDRVTNIRDKKNGTILWTDTDYQDGTRPTIFNVTGVTPILDPFNRVTEYFVMLEKADMNEADQ
jgi:hypothetical protein